MAEPGQDGAGTNGRASLIRKGDPPSIPARRSLQGHPRNNIAAKHKKADLIGLPFCCPSIWCIY